MLRRKHIAKPPKISVVILTANRPQLLNRCLASLKHQPITPLEIIVVDGSLDHDKTLSVTNKWAHRLPLTILQDTKHSIPYARNLGAKHSHGTIVVYLDDDLAADTDYLARMQRHFVDTPHLTAVMGRILNAQTDNVYASTQYAYYNRGLRHHFPSLKSVQTVISGRILDCEVMGIRKRTLTHVGFHGPQLYRNEDVELGLRLIHKKKYILFDPSILAWAWPRTSLLPLLWVSFRNGYWDGYIEKLYHIDLRAAPYRTMFFPWYWQEIRSKKTFSILKKIWYGILLISFPTITRIGKLWHHITTTL